MISGATIRKVTLGVAGLMLVPALASATPSTTYWAPSVATCQPKAVPHVTYDTYYGKKGSYPIDTGLTIGVLPGDKVQAEVGYDLLLPGSNPTQFYLNGKICFTENSMGKGVPGVGVGIMNVGFADGTRYNMVYAVAQKTLPIGGYIAAGFYHGISDKLFYSSEGKKTQNGAIVAWSSPDIKVGVTGLDKILLVADVQTGKNGFGAGGPGVYFYFNSYVDLLVGPVFFFDKTLQPGGSSMLWTTQVDIDIPLGKKKP